jgi:ABC-2 type transport system permease protein
MVAMFISAAGLMLPVMLLSGMIFPIENMPLILQWISYIVPARWYISAIRKLMIEGLPLIYVWKELSILLAMTLFFIVVSLKNFKERL